MGVWRVQDYGSPYDRTNPTILVAHRFGYLKWSNQYRHENSFYNLPKLEAGDRLEIVWRQRKYIYEIYASSEGTDIADYSANLILYTCKDLTGDIKIFKYARLLEI
jgi:sortase (surface protein transpeptidase)